MKQCGNCQHAISYPVAPSPSSEGDGVECNSLELAQELDSQSGLTTSQDELKEYGAMNLFRLEVLVNPEYECPYWK